VVMKITLTLSDGDTLEFIPKHQTIIKVLRGIMTTNFNNFVNKAPNGKEALMIVSAPENVLWHFNDNSDCMSYIQEDLNK